MTASPATTVAAVLSYIARWHEKRGHGPPGPKEFRENGALAARIDGTDPDGSTLVTVVSKAHAWRLRVYAAAQRAKVVVSVEEGMGEDENGQ